MKAFAARFLILTLLTGAIAPAFASGAAAAMHVLGCEAMAAAGGHHGDHGRNPAPMPVTDNSGICPLSASCLPGIPALPAVVSAPAEVPVLRDTPMPAQAIAANPAAIDPPPPKTA